MRNIIIIILVLFGLQGFAQTIPQINNVPWYQFNRKLSIGERLQIPLDTMSMPAGATVRDTSGLLAIKGTTLYFLYNGTWINVSSASATIDSSIYATVYRTDTIASNLRASIAGKLNISDTSGMLTNYFNQAIRSGDSIIFYNDGVRLAGVYAGGAGASGTWGGITGNLPDQTDLQTALNAKAPTTRAINTTAPLTGGGDLSADRTLSMTQASATVDGYLDNLDFQRFEDGFSSAIGINAIVSGNAVWSGSGLVYDVTACVYYIDGVRYTSAAGQVTLDAADGTNPRLDVIYLSTSGTFGKLTGTPGVNPAKPVVDPATQIELTTVLVAAGATTPSNVSNENVYLENAEWTTATSGSGGAVFNSTAGPYSGVLHINVNDDAGGGCTLQFTDAGSNLVSAFTTLNFRVKLGASPAFPSSGRFTVTFYNGTTAVSNTIQVQNGGYGFSGSNTSGYQLVSIPLSAFSFSGTSFTRIQIVTAANGGSTFPDFWMDEIVLQAGNANSGPSGVITFNGRNGNVQPQSGDYLASMVTNTPGGNIAATTVQAAINELDTEKALASHTHAAADITSGIIAAARLGTGTADGTTVLYGNGTWAAPGGGINHATKTWYIEAPSTLENLTLFYTDNAITITKVADATGGSGQTINYQINHATTRDSGSPNTLFSSDRTASSASGGTTTTFNDATIPAGSWVWLTSSATGGSITKVSIAIKFTYD